MNGDAAGPDGGAQHTLVRRGDFVARLLADDDEIASGQVPGIGQPFCAELTAHFFFGGGDQDKRALQRGLLGCVYHGQHH